MIRKILLLATLMFIFRVGYAQSYKTYLGKVYDSNNQPVSHSSVIIKTNTGSKKVITNDLGEFVFKNINNTHFSIKYTCIGFNDLDVNYNIGEKENIIILQSVKLIEQTRQLNDVTIVGRKRIEYKTDTIQYNTEYIKATTGAQAADLIKRLPGAVYNSNGQILIHGQTISKIRINGKDFLDGDLNTINGLIPSNLIDNIQIVRDYGEIANLTGNKAKPYERVININLKKDIKKGIFGSIEGSLGTEKRRSARINSTIQNEDQQLSLTGGIDNTNIGRGGTGAGGLTELSDGINNTKSIGINYRNNISKSAMIYGSYNLLSNNISSKNNISRETIYPGYTIFSEENRISDNLNRSEKLSFSLDYKLSKNDFIKVSPELKFNNQSNFSAGDILTNNKDLITNLHSRIENASKIPGKGISMFMNHSFNKPGRNINLQLATSSEKEALIRNINNNETEGFNSTPGQRTRIDINSHTNNLSVGIVEPLTSTSFIDLNLGINERKSINRINTELFDKNNSPIPAAPDLSDIYSSEYLTKTITTGYRIQKRIMNAFIGLNVINTVLEGKSVHSGISTKQDQINYAPNIRLNFNFPKGRSITAEYTGTTSSPGIEQLLPVRDIQNVQNIIIGNPNLKPEFNNVLRLHLNSINVESGRSYFIGFEMSQTNNKIIQARYSDSESLIQKTSYKNAHGYLSTRISYSITQPMDDNKALLVLTGSADKSNNISYLNDIISKGSNFLISQQVIFRTFITKRLENQFNVDYSVNRSKFPEQEKVSSIQSLKFGVSGDYSFSPKSKIGYDINKILNDGYQGVSKINPLVLNIFYELFLLKNNSTSIKITGLDLFNQNASISRDVFSNTISNNKSNRLSRYFLITIKYRIQNIQHKS